MSELDKYELFNKIIIGEIARITIERKGFVQEYRDYKKTIINKMEVK